MDATKRHTFWLEQAKLLDWTVFPKETHTRAFQGKWFEDGMLNVAANCLRHNPDKMAIIWQGAKEKKALSYGELKEKVAHVAAGLQALGVKQGDVVTIYLPLIPEAIASMLACAYLGAVHNVVFSAFSAQALKERIQDAGSTFLITCDRSYHKGKYKNQLGNARKARENLIKKTVVLQRTNAPLEKEEVSWDSLFTQNSVQPTTMPAEAPLFVLYTSGSTGKPKGIIHRSGGYATYAVYTTKHLFNHQNNDVHWCTADIGWITGHTYVVYGPLLLGTTIFLYEESPLYPKKNTPFELIQKNNISTFYTAPTLIRMLIKNKEVPDLHSLRLLGSVGEPLHTKEREWFYKKVGKENCPLIDTWWQTETGGVMMVATRDKTTPAPLQMPLPPITCEVVNEQGESVKEGELIISSPWPGLFQQLTDPTREKVYFNQEHTAYYPADSARKEGKGILVTGRSDDCMNVAGHLLSTAELENCITSSEYVLQAAVIGKKDALKGEVPIAFIVGNASLSELNDLLSTCIGPFAKVKTLYQVEDLPKTRSGKTMRRLLKAIVEGKDLGDYATLANPECVEEIRAQVSK